MTCVKETHNGYPTASHASMHLVYAEAVVAGFDQGRYEGVEPEIARAAMYTAEKDVHEAIELGIGSADECARMLGKIIKVTHPYVASPEAA